MQMAHLLVNSSMDEKTSVQLAYLKETHSMNWMRSPVDLHLSCQWQGSVTFEVEPAGSLLLFMEKGEKFPQESCSVCDNLALTSTGQP